MKITFKETGGLIIDGEGSTVIYGTGLLIIEGYKGNKSDIEIYNFIVLFNTKFKLPKDKISRFSKLLYKLLINFKLIR